MSTIRTSIVRMESFRVACKSIETISILIKRIGELDPSAFIRFAPKHLEWTQNELGVTKYSILTTNREWSLNSITIEELL